MTQLDPRYILMQDLQELFRDKTTGLPMAAGVVKFFEDNSRTTPQSVFTLAGTPGNYTYTDLGNEITLNSVGAFDVPIYYFPYTDSTAKTFSLYFIQVYNSDAEFQFSLEAWPNAIATTTNGVVAKNYILNPQFLSHIDVPATNTTHPGQIIPGNNGGVTDIAYGFWTYEVPPGSSTVDLVTFVQYPEFSANPPGSPRYAVQVMCESPDTGDLFKDIRVRFNNVNTFADTQLTFACSAKTTTGSLDGVKLIFSQFFGQGGIPSTPSELVLGNFTTITSAFNTFFFSFFLSNNSGDTVGQENDDFLQFCIRLPNQGFTVQFTDIILTDGTYSIAPVFPTTTQEQEQLTSIGGTFPVPAPDGSNLYLPMVLTLDGVAYDSSEVGFVYPAVFSTLTGPFLPADGVNTYYNNLTSPIGIPYNRLGKRLYNPSVQAPIFGTGPDFFIAIYPLNTVNEFLISNNSPGSTTATADGNTGFEFETVHTGATGYFTECYLMDTPDVFTVQNLEMGSTALSAPADGTTPTGFTFPYFQPNSAVLPQIFSVLTTVAAGLTGAFFTFSSIHNNVQLAWYVWFKVDGVGSDPAPGGTGILVNLESADLAAAVCIKTQNALNGWQVSAVFTNAASTLAQTGPGSYFFSTSTLREYYIWYNINKINTDPHQSGLPIEVPLTGTETDAQVAAATQIAINKYAYATPDLRGAFIRGWNNGGGLDPETIARYSFVTGLYGDQIGTYQNDELKQHTHSYFEMTAAGNVVNSGGNNLQNNAATTGATGTYEVRPINMALNYVIKY